MDPKILTTTPYNPKPEDELRAGALSAELGLELVSRRKDTIAAICRRRGAQGALVISANRVFLTSGQRAYHFHPSMALHRIALIRHGKTDRYIQVAGIRSGDRVLDCTCGMAADALVASRIVGERGQVITLESSPILHTLVQNGLANYEHRHEDLVDAMQRLTVIHQDYHEFLKHQEDSSFDVVYLDPMFDTAFSKGRGLDLVQLLSDRGRPDHDVLQQAMRVARRRVLIKDRVPGKLLDELKAPKIHKSRKIWYGIWEK